MPSPTVIMTESFPMRGPGATLPSHRSENATIEGTLKSIVNVNGSVESYDRAADPGETRNLAPSAGSRRMAEEIVG